MFLAEQPTARAKAKAARRQKDRRGIYDSSSALPEKHKDSLEPSPGGESTELGPQVRNLDSFLAAVLPDKDRLSAAALCLEQVRLLVGQVLGEGAAVVVQGSYAQGLALSSSDIDVAVVMNPSKPGTRRAPKATSNEAPRGQAYKELQKTDRNEKRRAVTVLQRLAHTLALAKAVELRIVQRIFTAQVPLLRLRFNSPGGGGRAPQRIVVDVSVGGNLARGACDRCVHSILERASSSVPAGLCRLVKIWAKRRELTSTLRGGLSSFAFVLLTTFFLQHLPRQGALATHRLAAYAASGTAAPSLARSEALLASQLLPSRRSVDDELGPLLVAFFDWAVDKIPKYEGQGISVVTGKVEPPGGSKKSGARISHRKPLFLQVPFAPRDNAARCLRVHVWERRVFPEMQRGKRISQDLLHRQPRRRAAALQALFEPASRRSGSPVSEEASEAVPDTASESEVAPVSRGSSPRSGTKSRGAFRASKRRRILRRELAAEAAAAEAPEQPPPASKHMVGRWLGLRAMLATAEEQS